MKARREGGRYTATHGTGKNAMKNRKCNNGFLFFFFGQLNSSSLSLLDAGYQRS